MKKYDIEINKEMVLCTSHVTAFECNGNTFSDYSSDDAVIRLHVETVLEDIEEGDKSDLYPNIKRLCQIAESHGCKWLVLDSCVEKTDGLQTFEW